MGETSAKSIARVRVAAVLPSYFGGGETVTNALVKALRPKGYEFILITHAANAEKRSEVIREMFDDCVGVDIDLAHYSLSTTKVLTEILRPLKIDILWLIGDEFSNIPTLREALNPGAKIFYHLHSVPFYQAKLKDTFHGKRSNIAAYAGWFLIKHLREKLFNSYQLRYMQRSRQTAADTDRFITISQGYTRQLAALNPDLAAKFLTIHNPLIQRTGTFSLIEKQNEILFLGRLTRADKRPDLLLKIFAKVASSHPQWQLKIVGDGPERQNLEQLARELHIDRQTQFVGYSANPAEHLAAASILCMTSAFEGWGMALVEALQYGVAPMAFNCSAGVEEILTDGRGILVPPGEIDRYAAELARLMDSAVLRQELVGSASKFLKSLSITNIAPQWEQLFNE
ncbi:MAG: glycosyltransferase [Bacteroides sp.]|nr:glycosyltransferase [Bacteroides sp.]MCM1378596.1 glycosyltransferase [Bacteroides sp.]MCM1444897.1 glycosyltransferase [Prevotella sp.]